MRHTIRLSPSVIESTIVRERRRLTPYSTPNIHTVNAEVQVSPIFLSPARPHLAVLPKLGQDTLALTVAANGDCAWVVLWAGSSRWKWSQVQVQPASMVLTHELPMLFPPAGRAAHGPD
ncbi:unnamed protein product [Aspergillus oryzae]|uniref:Unnamed protein product n=2 Tax=Aspergillus oryzae TaxID=5062 RepID=A0AAN4YIE4_ASPOZ|nr:unnamed protein product [Aspergillus oryzae]GMF96638.1 unnamed protein product [Aspergillus oryzae]GMG05689.1 unnamed protein product [Aspergillus oryzae]GMG28102.1 unnamed protein product [Aspergillus oryzae]GMG41468.1 unnamed protein product [Aspergillus oryzae var. brunneus]